MRPSGSSAACRRCPSSMLLSHDNRRDSIIPGVAVSKWTVAKIVDAAIELLATTCKVSIIEDDYASAAKEPDRGDIVSKIAWQVIEPVSALHTEAIAFIACVLEKTSSSTRERTPVPRRVPIIVAAVSPLVLSLDYAVEQERTYQQ